jgi:UDP-glucose-4-epimerase GalE
MNILVTGGAGYIGSHAVRMLAAQGHRVRIYDNLSLGHRELVQGFELIEADIGDGDRLRPALDGIELVMHFAASAYVGESFLNPRKYFTNNVVNGLSLLNAAVDAGVRQFVFSSTCAVYGAHDVRMTESTPCSPINPYGDSKLFFERALDAYDRQYGLRSVRLRYFNASGADESCETGELHEPETHLMPLALEVAAGWRPALELFGDDYPTPDGTCIRDFIHVTDLSRAHARAAEYLQRGGASCALNLGSGQGHSVKEVLSTIERITGRPVPTRVKARRPGDPPILLADASLAKKILGWTTACSLDQIVTSAWQWMHSENCQKLRRVGVKSEV